MEPFKNCSETLVVPLESGHQSSRGSKIDRCVSGAESIEDWTEKYRPTSMSQMEGNDSQLRMIAQWLDRWASGKIPDKRGLLLVGPPRSGKDNPCKSSSQRTWLVNYRIECLRRKKCRGHSKGGN